ncbi:uncharacterized protein EMH_0091510 [Eimeria mitis]|uniref:Uncharacterized protein n=1 Tax=Eimeria mitis TaxID=44415 RepID=U6KEE4_9EIME|nr:uncharacterized protein EMH_0091510 [Eimeria mitis]CDJ34627.1 hypothetical protein EMH_0091510 [Eimeria mitis]
MGKHGAGRRPALMGCVKRVWSALDYVSKSFGVAMRACETEPDATTELSELVGVTGAGPVENSNSDDPAAYCAAIAQHENGTGKPCG